MNIFDHIIISKFVEKISRCLYGGYWTFSRSCHCCGLFYLNQVKSLGYKLVNWIVFLIFLETITGILMYYADIPLGTQAIHLMAGAILFGLQFYLWMQSRLVNKSL